MTEILIIGYGNTLRGDDGAGQRVAEMVSEWGLDEVRSLSVHQLTPELAEPISTAKLAIFVDAYPDTDSQGLQVRRLEDPPPPPLKRGEPEGASGGAPAPLEKGGASGGAPAPLEEGGAGGGNFSHNCDPRSLLQMAKLLYGSAPPAWWLLVPAVNFDFGEDFSAVTAEGIVEVLSKIKELLVGWVK
jgi:Ni,Fe-hydrogenase maturation factor